MLAAFDLWREAALTVPLLFFAVTVTRSVAETSFAVTAYVFDVWFTTGEQNAPFRSQRDHWYA